MFRVVILVVFVFVDYTDTACDGNFGPALQSDCILIPNYDGYQWATCLTDSFIRRESNGRHYCLNDNTYCYYQCMVEINSKEGGVVYDNCSCIGEESVPQYSNVSLPSWCYMPNKTNCQWYSNCYDGKYGNCSTNDTDGMVFLRSYCSTANTYRRHFSVSALNVLDEIGVCFKIDMVKVLRPWIYYKCNEISLLTTSLVRNCMATIDLCDIDVDSMSTMLITLANSLPEQSRYAEDLSQMPRIRSLCSTDSTFSDYQYISVLRLETKVGPSVKNPVHKLVITIDAQLVHKIISALSKKLGWNAHGLLWLAWEEATATKALQNMFDIKVLIASKQKFDLNFTGGGISRFKSINNSVYDIGNIITNKTVFSLNHISVIFSSLDSCTDLQCQHIYYSIGTTDKNGRHILMLR